MEVWRQIREFPGYSVGDEGHVRNDKFDRLLTMSVNQHGCVHVGLFRERVQFKRSVALLVAQAFVPKLAPQRESFDTPINLDGNRMNNHAANIMWRPRWFAVKYFRQFYSEPQGFSTPIIETISGATFANSWEAAITFGLLDKDILLSTINRTFVWPTFQRFRLLD